MLLCAPPPVQTLSRSECKQGKDCKFAHQNPNYANAGRNSSAGSGQTVEEESPAKAMSRAKAKAKGKNAFVAKTLLGIAGATQIIIGQSMLVFASVTSICDDRTVSNMVEDYRSEDSLFSWKGMSAGGNFQQKPACGILRAPERDHLSLSLKVKFLLGITGGIII